LRQRFARIRLSPAYCSAAVGFDGNDFINLVAAVETDMGPLELREFLHGLEDRHGRARNVPKFSDRTLDVDILLYDDLYLISPLLEIPRDEILTAAHVLKPLADLAPDLRHPVARQSMSRLWEAFPLQEAGLELIEL
jgi:2-amino-4-hydroxy-6-hydroxymethyldihydropteridine diphosphokinase